MRLTIFWLKMVGHPVRVWRRAGHSRYSRERYHDELFDVARQDRRYSHAATGEAVARVLDQGGEEAWHSWWLDPQKFLRETN